MRRKKLEILLQGVRGYRNPKARMEQYLTPASVAADILFRAYYLGDIRGRTVGDLGSGTGIFSIGSCILGASRVYAVEIDEDAILVLKENLSKFECKNVDILKEDIGEVSISVDTVIQNPPFGSQRRHADIPFLVKSLEIGRVIYTLHNASTAEFIRNKILDLGGEITDEVHYDFKIPRVFSFHTHERIFRDVILFRIVKQ